MLQTKKGDPNRPHRIMIYGPEGVGKSTFGSMAGHPVFIGPEGGTDRLRNNRGEQVDEMPNVKTWEDVLAAIAMLRKEAHDFDTLVIDSADWIEKIAHQKIIGTSGKTITTVNGGYGSGFSGSEMMHKFLIDRLEELRDERRMNIIVTAHAHVKPVKDPEMAEDYDSYEIKCHEKVSSLWREWVDALFFVRFRTFVTAGEGGSRARALTDETRVMHTVKKPAFQAKNRYGLPPEMDFTFDTWKEFSSLVAAKPKAELDEAGVLQLKDEINGMWLGLDAILAPTVAKEIEKAGNNVAHLQALKSRLLQITGGAK